MKVTITEKGTETRLLKREFRAIQKILEWLIPLAKERPMVEDYRQAVEGLQGIQIMFGQSLHVLEVFKIREETDDERAERERGNGTPEHTSNSNRGSAPTQHAPTQPSNSAEPAVDQSG
jgi:hypothetical protein